MRLDPDILRRASILLLLGIVAACSKQDMADPVPGPAPQASDELEAPVAQLGTAVEPTRYAIELRIDPSEERYAGNTTIDIVLHEPRDHIWLHGKDLAVGEVYLIDGAGERVAASYEERHPSGVALVEFERRVAAGPASLHFSYDTAFNTDANALYKVVRGKHAYAATQFQAIAARQVFPGFDEPVFKVPFDLTVIARADDVVITTTPEASRTVLDDGFVRHDFDTTRPLPTYLLAFAVGPYDLVDYGTIPPNGVRERELPLRAVAAKGLGDRLEYGLKHTDGLLTELEEYFGTPYPYRKLDLIAAPESFGGAMENVGAILYDEYLLLMDERSPLRQRRLYTMVHAHELAHMWFGNLVTPAWWNDIWLNESFASWVQYKAALGYWPEGEFDRALLRGALSAMANDSLASARQIREPVDHNDRIEDAFDSITYEKGAGVLAMLERYVGAEQFRSGVRLHMSRHADGSATAEDFVASLAEGSERAEIEAAFRSFTEQPGVPLVAVQLRCDADRTPRLQVTQARYAPLGSAIDPAAASWDVPMCVSFGVDGRRDSLCTLVNEKQQSFDLDASSCPTWVHPNADGAGYYRFSLDDAAWDKLLAHAAQLPAAEALAVADSLDAALRARLVSPGAYARGMASLVAHEAWDVAETAVAYLEKVTDIVAVDQHEPILQAFRGIARPRFAELKHEDGAGPSLLRRSLQRFLIVIARDEDLRRQLAGQAAAVLGLDGEADPHAAPVDEFETIFTAGLQELGRPFFALLLQETLRAEDPAFRLAGAGALARVEDPELVEALHSALLGEGFKGTEFRRVLFRQMLRPATTDVTFEWIRQNTDAVLQRLPGGLSGRVLPSLGRAFCSDGDARRWEAFILSHADDLAGYERDLAQTLETVRLCTALREQSAAGLVAAFAAYAM